MPGLGNYRLALGVRLRIPKVPVLLCSTPRPDLRRLLLAYDVNNRKTELRGGDLSASEFSNVQSPRPGLTVM